ncbi:response regulator [Ideonella sp. B7]|uniref:ATP-binding protein n=1 Tax=Ideonella benzenivorans TaxID=2831643 RepID=UPI001CED5690|nr:ATP-binding protein [Ideonella benzenivorans]MCA6215220.1 response regulator [Ideonella benzenivorans]
MSVGVRDPSAAVEPDGVWGRRACSPVFVLGGWGAYYLLALGCIVLSRLPQEISTLWLPDALAVLWLLMLPAHQRRWPLLGLALVIPAANLSYGDPWRLAVSFTLANLSQIALAVWLLERHVQPRRALTEPAHLLRAMALGGAVPAAFGGGVASLIVPVVAGSPLGPSVAQLWWSWVVSTFFGAATLLPLGLWVLVHGSPWRRLQRPRVLAALAGVALCCWFVPQFVFMPFLYLMVMLGAVALAGGFLLAAVAAILASVLLNAQFALGLTALQQAHPGAAAMVVTAMLVTVIPTVLIGAVRERLQLQLRQVQDGEALLRSMADATPVLLCLVDAQERIVQLNPAGARLLGASSPQELQGRPLGDLLPVRVARDGQGVLTRLALSTGPARHGMLYRVPVAGTQQGGAVYSLLDVTDQLEAEQWRAQAAQAEARSQAKSALLSHMSHELRTPLNAVLGFAQLLQTELGQAPVARQQERLRHVLQSGWHLLGMIDELLDLSRIEAGQLALDCRPVALASLLGEALAMVQADAARRQILVQTPPALGAHHVHADPLRLRQVLINLLSNAVKYNREGGRVRVEVTAEAGHWTVAVSDTGLGIRAAQQPHLFEPFNRLDQARSAVPGTGIGLTITRRLVEAMGGRLGFTSEAGVGSTFWVSLPAAEAPVQGPVGGRSSELLQVRPARVLCVEDDPVSALLVSQALALDGHQVQVAGSAGDALRLAQAAPPELMLIDFRLPDFSGPALRQRLGDDPRLAEVPCIALTAQATDDDRRAAGPGWAAFLAKPVDLSVLRHAAAAALRESGGRPRA